MATKAKKQQTVTFMSPSRNLRVVREPQRRVVDAGREYYTDGIVYEFVNGRLDVSDPDAVAWLRDKIKFDEERGHGKQFSEIPPAPPDAQPDIDRITDMAVRVDIDGIHKLLEEEERGHQRQVVIDTARRAMDAILAEAERQQQQAKA